MAVVFINELLCFLCKRFDKFNKVQLKAILLGFYSEVELSEAKDILYADAAKLNIADLPRCVKRAKGGSRAWLIAEDLLDLFAFLDENKALGQLPVYVAHDLDRVPLVKVEDMELFCVSQKIADIEKRLFNIEACNTNSIDLGAIVAKVEDVCQRVEKSPAVAVLSYGDESVDEPASSIAAAVNNDPMHSMVGGASNEWATVTRRKSIQVKPIPTVRVYGKKAADTVKAVPRSSILSAFVGRLHQDTTAEELTEYLLQEGMKGVVRAVRYLHY
jgi:hypothetical protein